jgi:hypothetical protein
MSVTKTKPSKINLPKHKERTLDAIKSHGSISPWYAAIHLGNLRLAATINQLRKEGHVITSEKEWGKNAFQEDINYKRYTYVSGPDQD